MKKCDVFLKNGKVENLEILTEDILDDEYCYVFVTKDKDIFIPINQIDRVELGR